MQIKIFNLFLLIYISIVITSCTSSGKIWKEGTLSGVIVDENNNPVSDCVVNCYVNGKRQTAITNESGIFVLPYVKTGIYFLQGEKYNYTKIEKQEYYFNDCSSFLCIQIKSLNEIIKNIDTFLRAKEFEKGVKLLHSVKVKKGSFSETVCICYEAYMNFMLGNMDVYTRCIDKLKKIKNDKCNLFINKMENFIYE